MAILSRKPKDDQTSGSDVPAKVPLKKAPDLDPDVQARQRRSLARLAELRPKRNECWEFFRGNTYVHVTKDQRQLVQTSQGMSVRAGEPDHKVRTQRPILTPFVRQEVSYATQRVPGYDVVPTNIDPETVAAAKAAEKVALYGYEKWSVKHATEKLVTSAIVADEAFAWPYWDDSQGTIIGEDEYGTLGEGEVCIRTYTSGEVTWEPGVRYEDSPYWVIQQARPVDEVLKLPKVIVSELAPDATDTTVIGTGKPNANTKLVLVTEYLERPTGKYPKGRRIVSANGKRILPVEDYPLQDSQGRVVNEPVLLKLTVIVDPDSDHDHGLVKFGLDPLRTYQEAHNKILQYSKYMLPQMIVPPGTKVPFDDTPMAVFEHPRPGDIKFRETLGIPSELFEIADRAFADLARLFSQNEIPGQVEAAKAIQALIDRDMNARSSLISNLAELHARLMHRCLNLVAKYYTEPRLISVTGDFGTEIIEGFLGSSLLHQTQVRVLPQSLEAKTREQVKQDVAFFAQLQWVGPEDGIAAIQDGTTDNIGADFEYDRARAYEIIQNIKAGPAVLFGMPAETRMMAVPVTNPDGSPVIDPMTGVPLTQQVVQEVPGWMPREVDNTAIHRAIFARWMKSAEWRRTDQGMREATRLYMRALDDEDKRREMERAQQQSAQAAGQGLGNAAKPQVGEKPMPSLPNPAADMNPMGAQQ